MPVVHKTEDKVFSVPLGNSGETAISLKELRHVAFLVESRNFIRAAQRSGVSQSALSQSVAALESRLGVLLFNRSRRQVIPTPVAELIAERATLVLNTLSDMSAQIDALRDARDGSVVCGIGAIPANRLMAESILRFNQRHPGVRIRVDVTYNLELISDLLEGKIEFCVSIPEKDMDTSELQIESLYEERLGYVCRRAHPLTCYEVVPATEIVKYPIIANSGPHLRQLLSRRLRTAADFQNLELNAPSLTLQRLDLLAPVVVETDYVLLGALSTFDDWLSDGRLVPINVDHPLPQLGVCIVTRKGLELSPAARRLTGIIREIACEVRSAETPPAEVPVVLDGRIAEITTTSRSTKGQTEHS